MWFAILIAALTSYLLGNLNGSVCISALMKDDVRNHGSGNAGLTNFFRSYGFAGTGLVLLVLFTPLAALFGLIPLSGGLYLAGVGLILMPLVVMELAKLLGLVRPV